MAAGRKALVVATYEYSDGGLRRLAAPEHDADSFAGVLQDPAIAGFDVTMLVNQPHYVVGEAIADFYGEAGREDLTLLYFTGHGVKDDEGRLYLAMTNTRRDALMFTAISGAQLNDAMDASRSRRKVLILDCCYSGAFPAGRAAKADEGVQTLERSGFDPRAMPAFLDRLQRAYRIYETSAPAYVRTHPLTTERIADVQNRVEGLPYKQVPDSLEFQLVRARLEVMQYPPRDAVERFEDILKEKKTVSEIPARYGLTMALLEAKDMPRATREAELLLKAAPDSSMVAVLVANVRMAAGDRKGAFELYAEAIKRFPRWRALIYDYTRALLLTKRPREALQITSNASQFLHSDRRLYQLQAQAYAALGQKLQECRAQAEAFVIMGNLSAAINQLQMGLRSGDGDYYQLSSAEARLRELRALEAESKRSSQR